MKHNNQEIEVLDAIMGSGKTQGIIKWMLERPNRKYLYVSPLLSEVEDRIPQSCESMGFVSPSTTNHKTKGEHLLELVKEGQNVSFTHSLFTSLTPSHLYWLDLNNYTLIMDEEIDFIEPYPSGDLKPADIMTLEQSGHLSVDTQSFGRVDWTWSDETYVDGGKYSKLKRMCELEMLHVAKRSREMMVLHLPIGLIQVMERVIVLTYKFKGSVMNQFMELKGVAVKDFTELSLQHSEAEIRYRASERFEVVRTRTSVKVEKPKYGLSYTWWSNANPKDLADVERAIESCCRKGGKSDVIYTFPKDILYNPRAKAKVAIKGYGRDECWLYCATKATNEYSGKTVLVHAYNRFPNQGVNAYLADYNLPVDSDAFALSELIQWVWRSNIRVVDSKKTIYIALLHPRMRGLFERWLREG